MQVLVYSSLAEVGRSTIFYSIFAIEAPGAVPAVRYEMVGKSFDRPRAWVLSSEMRTLSPRSLKF